jgi:hypothetical protein
LKQFKQIDQGRAGQLYPANNNDKCINRVEYRRYGKRATANDAVKRMEQEYYRWNRKPHCQGYIPEALLK